MENNYPKAYKEVVEILKYVPKESVDKIPQTMLDTLNIKMDNNYNFSIVDCLSFHSSSFPKKLATKKPFGFILFIKFFKNTS